MWAERSSLHNLNSIISIPANPVSEYRSGLDRLQPFDIGPKLDTIGLSVSMMNDHLLLFQ